VLQRALDLILSHLHVIRAQVFEKKQLFSQRSPRLTSEASYKHPDLQLWDVLFNSGFNFSILHYSCLFGMINLLIPSLGCEIECQFAGHYLNRTPNM
jgi:hypothetical protein